MKKIILAVLMMGIFFVSQAQADYKGQVSLRIVAPFSYGSVLVAIDNPPAGTCDYWSYSFVLDASTSGGDQIYKTLMTAVTMSKPVDIWFNPTSVPGANQHSGCTQDTMAILVGAGLHQN